MSVISAERLQGMARLPPNVFLELVCSGVLPWEMTDDTELSFDISGDVDAEVERVFASHRPPAAPPHKHPDVPDDLRPALRATNRKAGGSTFYRNGGVYFLRAGESGPIKIGRAARFATRLVAIQAMNHETLTVLGVIPQHRHSDRWVVETEQYIHRRFADAHMRGEWFNPEPELLAWIGANSSPVRRTVDEFIVFWRRSVGLSDHPKRRKPRNADAQN